MLHQLKPIAGTICLALIAAGASAEPATRPFADFQQAIPDIADKLDMVAIKGGKFTLIGTPDGKPREVEVKDFYIGKMEVTWEFFDTYSQRLDQTPAEKAIDDALPNEKRSRPSITNGAPDHGFGHAGYPVLSTTHKNAARYCQWLSQKTGRKYRLPTEAEWEYAARAGGGHEVPAEALPKIAWFADNADDKTHVPGGLAANAWGLHDMLGNVMEWCDGPDGIPVTRGGSWQSKAKGGKISPPLNYAWRAVYDETWHLGDPQDPKSTWWLPIGKHIGFRVVCEP